MKRKVEYTLPALFNGLWTLVAILNTLEDYTPDELKAFAKIALGQPP